MSLLAWGLAALPLIGAAADAPDDDLAAALTEGDPGLALRYRLELVDDDNFAEDAEASTLRLRLNYLTGSWRNWQAFVELDHVLELGWDDFNSGAGTSSPPRNRFPVVADPDGSDLNQAWLQATMGERGRLRLGRQRIVLDNQRFVGGVGWRQNEQTYDAASLGGQMLGAEWFYAYVANVNRIFGDDVPAGDHDSNTHLLNGSWALGEANQLVGYAYLIDNDDQPSFSTDTYGLRWTGQTRLASRPLDYLLEYAHQRDAANHPVDYDADYLHLNGKMNFAGWSADLGYERLGSGDTPGGAFQTPLATAHAFNGWADRFLSTPDAGLEDTYVRIAGNLRQWHWQLIWHHFETDNGSTDLGSELDAALQRQFGRYGLLFKFAGFDGDGPLTDTTRTWLMLSAAF